MKGKVKKTGTGDNSPIRRVLIFEPNWLGDILFSFPLIRAIKKAFPEAYIACAVVSRYKDLLVRNPLVDDVMCLSDKKGLFPLREKAFFIRDVQKRAFDTCLLLKPSVTKARMSALAGIPRRIGFSGKNAALTQEIAQPAGHVHRIDQLLAIARVLGVSDIDREYEYFVSEEDIRRAGILLDKVGGNAKRLITVHPGGNWDAKRWPRGNFTELIKRLLVIHPGVDIMITGAGKDQGLAADIVKGVSDGRCYSVAGLTGLNVLAALFKLSALVISADSGPLHLASAAGADNIALFGPTSQSITGPRGKGRSIVIQHDVGCETPCYEPECGKGYECMRAITVEEVYESASKMLEGEERNGS